MEAKKFTEDFIYDLMDRKVLPKIVEIGKIETCNHIYIHHNSLS
jgi:hypothetical protein